jgi:spore coat protein A
MTSLNRRQLLASIASGITGALLPTRVSAGSDEARPNTLVGVRLEPFVDPLFIPPVLRQSGAKTGSCDLRIRLSEFRQKLHRDLPPAIVWGFEGCTPGPTIEAKRGQPLTVEWSSQLPVKHRLLVDHTIDGAGADVPEVRTTIHLHGGHVSAQNDGYPETWIVPGQKQQTFYPNQQPGATLWYHDHAMGITRLNAMMGLAGVYRLIDPEEQHLGLPSGAYDVPLTLQDRTLDARGQIAYGVSETPGAPALPEFFGTHILVNGRVSPYFDVEPRLYRFRFLNASNARTFHLSMQPDQYFVQIGTDGGLLPGPVPRKEFLLAPGERIECIIDFRGREGRRIDLVNYAPAPYPSGGQPVPGLALQFRIRRPLSQNVDVTTIPESLSKVPRISETSAVKTRRLKLVEVMPTHGQRHRVLLDGRRFMDPISEDPRCGSTEIWEFVNTTIDAHPIHLHAVHFQLLGRQPFDLSRFQRTSEVVLTQSAVEPPPHELGWKDTIICPPGQVTRIIIPFSAEPGRFVWHCHMLEHEDNEMMRPYLIRT